MKVGSFSQISSDLNKATLFAGWTDAKKFSLGLEELAADCRMRRDNCVSSDNFLSWRILNSLPDFHYSQLTAACHALNVCVNLGLKSVQNRKWRISPIICVYLLPSWKFLSKNSYYFTSGNANTWFQLMWNSLKWMFFDFIKCSAKKVNTKGYSKDAMILLKALLFEYKGHSIMKVFVNIRPVK